MSIEKKIILFFYEDQRDVFLYFGNNKPLCKKTSNQHHWLLLCGKCEIKVCLKNEKEEKTLYAWIFLRVINHFEINGFFFTKKSVNQSHSLVSSLFSKKKSVHRDFYVLYDIIYLYCLHKQATTTRKKIHRTLEKHKNKTLPTDVKAPQIKRKCCNHKVKDKANGLVFGG